MTLLADWHASNGTTGWLYSLPPLHLYSSTNSKQSCMYEHPRLISFSRSFPHILSVQRRHTIHESYKTASHCNFTFITTNGNDMNAFNIQNYVIWSVEVIAWYRFSQCHPLQSQFFFHCHMYQSQGFCYIIVVVAQGNVLEHWLSRLKHNYEHNYELFLPIRSTFKLCHTSTTASTTFSNNAHQSFCHSQFQHPYTLQPMCRQLHEAFIDTTTPKNLPVF